MSIADLHHWAYVAHHNAAIDLAEGRIEESRYRSNLGNSYLAAAALLEALQP